MAPSTLDRFLGCMLGLAVGDAFGAPFEGLPAYAVYRDFRSMEKIIADPELDALTYTDDTQMAIAVAEALLEFGACDEEQLADAFARNYEPGRGYGQGARRLIEMMGSGGEWRSTRHTMFPGGSLGNGAAMRVAPVGLLFHNDLNRVAAEARISALPTHVHPIGIEGAQLLALAIAMAMRDTPIDRAAFFAELTARAVTEEFQHQLSIASRLGPEDSIGVLGSSLEAHRSVVTAIACFAFESESYESAIGRAVAFGDDTDTVAAMAGAVSGAHLGVGAIPPHLLNLLENGPKGRDYIEGLSFGLWERATKLGNEQ